MTVIQNPKKKNTLSVVPHLVLPPEPDYPVNLNLKPVLVSFFPQILFGKQNHR